MQGCPKCGSEDRRHASSVVDECGRRWAVCECRGCGLHAVDFTQQLDDASTVVTVKRMCPHCGSTNTITERTKGGVQVVRYHRCRECELTFKSTELSAVRA